MPPIKSYDPARLQATASALNDANSGIADELDRLSVQVETLRSTWDGEASLAYSTAQAQWTARLTEMSRILALAVTAMSKTAERQSQARAKISALWS